MSILQARNEAVINAPISEVWALITDISQLDKVNPGVIKASGRMDNPAVQDKVLEKTGCRIMHFTGRPMKGYIMVDNSGMKTKKEFDYWVKLCLDFNKIAKSSKKKK